MLSTYLSYRLYANNLPRSLQQTAAEPAVATQQKYYAANIGKVKSVDDFVGNYRLFSYAMKAAGLEDMTYAKAFMKKVLSSDLSNSKSFANSLTDTRYKAFAAQFNFSSSGTAGETAAAQAADQQANTESLYSSNVGSGLIKVGSDYSSGTLETEYYKENIGSVKNIGDLMNNSRLLSYVATAYGFNSATASESDITAVLESDSSDSTSTASQMARGDAVGLPMLAQTAADQGTTSTAYTKAKGRTSDLIYYENTINSVTSVDAFLADPKLVSVAETAYGLDTSYSTSDLKQILTSDLSNNMSVANLLGTAAKAFAGAFNFGTTAATSPFIQMAKNFNFDTTGAVTTQRIVQTSTNATALAAAYTSQAGTSTTAVAAAKDETTYYANTIGTITSLDGLLGDSRLVSYITKAFGIDSTKVSTDTLRKVLTSDLTDAKSTANTLGSNYRQLAASFNFKTSGTIARDAKNLAQTSKTVALVGDNFLRQTMEDEAGDQNTGVKLALYFQRKAPSITSVYSILADPALLKVAQVALNIPASSSSQDIEVQARQLTARLKLTDLQDPKKLNKLLSQFATLYDLSNSTSSTSS